MKSKLKSVMVMVGLTLAGETARAGGLDTYNAPVSGSDLLQVKRAHAETGHLQPFGRISLAYNNDPIILRNSDGSEVRLVNHQWGAYGAVGLSLWKRLQVAALLPVYYQSGESSSTQPGIGGAALGDAALDLRYALLGRDDLFELALAGRVAAPSGDERRMVGDGRASAQVGGIISREFGRSGVLLTSSISLDLRDRAGVAGGSGVLLGLGAAVPLADGVMLTGEGELATEVEHFLGETATPASFLGGLRWGFGGWVAHVGVGPGLSHGLGTPDFRVLGMFGTDAGFETAPTVAPAPRLVADTDRDGLEDGIDACLEQPEDVDQFQDQDGCPDPDNDADAVADTSDKCPMIAEDIDQFEDVDGCPELDNDIDGIADATDQCPVEAETKNGFQDEDGCPEVDADSDGVFEPADACPTEKETTNGVDDTDGCPDFLRVEEAQIRTLEPIYFETGSDRLQPRSLPLLQELANVIAGRPDLGLIAIEGHTDNAGSEKLNLKLSQKRAEAIRRTLIEDGVAESRLTAAGFGEMRPISSNETPAGREQNRRVEFRLADFVSVQ